ncbi:MAG: ABC transporter ATP-binding protein [Cyclobacteriaceae bacterium]|nr:ABC transporter ATP-binding protein [Cyclobacteriaceae bacterium]
MIKVEELYKSYQKTSALTSISFDVQEGEIFGVIGPDGAGKSTLIRILTTLLLPDKGYAEVMGKEVIKNFRELRKNIGYMPGRFSLYEDLTVEENLHLFASIFGTTLQANYHLIKDIYVQIEPFKNRRAGDLSGGMKQKLALSCSLIHAPRVIFLDEPTTGVDPVSRKEFWGMLRKLKSEGITILVSTPYMDEAAMCDTVFLVNKGTVLDIDTPQRVIEKFQGNLYAIKGDDQYRLLSVLRQNKSIQSVFLSGEYIHFTMKDKIPLNNLREKIDHAGLNEVKLGEITPTMEDCFLALMKS